MMQPRLEELPKKKLVGRHLRMSLADNKTPALWQSFMPQRKEIAHKVSADLFSLQVYDSPAYFAQFSPQTEFTKWAAAEVSAVEEVQAGLQTFDLPGGLYAVFLHRGGPATGHKTFGYIFYEWLPASGYALDDRPHFEILGEKYGNGGPDSEEEIWVPVKPKAD